MRNVFLILFVCSTAWAGGPKYTYPTVRGLDDEMNNIYHDLKYPIINSAVASTLTINSSLLIPDGSASFPSIMLSSDEQIGIFKPANRSIGFATDGIRRLWINGSGQQISTYDGTYCVPAWTFGTDAGTGLFMPASDNLGFTIGCSTGVIFHQHDYPNPNNFTLANIYTIYGASSTTPGTMSQVNFGIYTSTMTTTDNQIVQCNQLSCLAVISGRTTAYSAAFTDIILTSYYSPNPTVVASHNDLGTASARTYSSGGSSTGIVLCHVASGNYYTQAYITSLNGN